MTYISGVVRIEIEPLKADSNVATYVDGRPLSQSEKRARRAAHIIDLQLKDLRKDLLEKACEELGL
jgi:hypothetical protein